MKRKSTLLLYFSVPHTAKATPRAFLELQVYDDLATLCFFRYLRFFNMAVTKGGFSRVISQITRNRGSVELRRPEGLKIQIVCPASQYVQKWTIFRGDKVAKTDAPVRVEKPAHNPNYNIA